MVFCQETKMPKDKVEHLTFFSNSKTIGVYVDGDFRGIVVIFNCSNIKGEIILQINNMVNVRCWNTKDGTSWVQTNVYDPNTKWGRKYF